MPLDLVCAGNLLVDDIVLADGRTRMGEAGGAMLYTALGAAIWRAKVGIVSVLGTDYPASMLAALRDRGVDLGGVRALEGPGVRTWLLYEEDTRRVIHRLGRPSHDDVSPRPDDVPDSYRDARAFHVSPIPRALQHALVQALSGDPDRMISLDPHDVLSEDSLEPWLETLAHVDALFVGDDELWLDRLTVDPLASLERLGTRRMRFVAWKRAAAGGLLYDHRRHRLIEWRGNESVVVDGTGAGDAFAGGFLAGWLSSGDLDRALQLGAVSASFATDGWGAQALLAATPESAESRRRSWFGESAAPAREKEHRSTRLPEVGR